jgi:hypothetical protein
VAGRRFRVIISVAAIVAIALSIASMVTGEFPSGISLLPGPPPMGTRPTTDLSARPTSQRTTPRPSRDGSKDEQQDRELQAAFDNGHRWSRLPSFIYGVDCDASGHMWFNVFDTFTAQDFRLSVERAAHGQSRIIRGGKILIVDTKGRYWCHTQGFAHELLCYDGTHWLEPRSAAAGLAPAPNARPVTSYFEDCALEDSDGNLYFVSGGRPGIAGLHRFNSADRSWSFLAFPGKENFPREPMLAEQVGGRIAVYPSIDASISNIGDIQQVQAERAAGQVPHGRTRIDRAFIFDGKGLAVYQPSDRPSAELWVDKVIALPDGSVATFGDNFGQAIAVAWPTGTTPQLSARVTRLVAQLDDADPAKRDTASAELLKLGPPVRDQVEALRRSDEVSPQQRALLEGIASRMAEEAKDEKDTSAVLFGGRYHLERVSLVTRTVDRKVRLFAMKCDDRQEERSLGPTFLTISADGTWTAAPIPAANEKEDFFWLPSATGNAYEDITGALWLGAWNDIVLEPDFRIHPSALPGFKPYTIRGSDGEGRVYFQDWVCDRRVPEQQPELPMKLIDADRLYFLAGEPIAWGRNFDPFTIMPDGSTRTIPAPNHLCADGVYPMTKGTALVWFVTRSGPPYSRQPWLWDGQQWQASPAGDGDNAVRELIHAQAAKIVEVAGRQFGYVYDAQSRLLRLASDRGRGLWYETDESHMVYDHYPAQAEPEYHFEYFDGQGGWHDVQPILEAQIRDDQLPRMTSELGTRSQKYRAIVYAIVGLADDGHMLLMNSPVAGAPIGISFENGALATRAIQNSEEAGGSKVELVESSSQLAWLSWTAKPHVVMAAKLRNDALSPAIECPGKPVLVDAADRLWCVDGTRLSVTRGTDVASINVPALNEDARLTQSPDGRLWLLDASAISQLSVDGVGPAFSLRVEHRWAWNSPKNVFLTHCDAANGLWLNGNGGQIGRIALPSVDQTRPEK